jgi:hypothetical protein
VGGRYREAPRLLVGELLAYAPEVLDLRQDVGRDLRDPPPRLRQRREALAPPSEDLDPELILQFFDLF